MNGQSKSKPTTQGLAVAVFCLGLLTIAVCQTRPRVEHVMLRVVQTTDLDGQQVVNLEPMQPVQIGVVQEAGAPLKAHDVLSCEVGDTPAIKHRPDLPELMVLQMNCGHGIVLTEHVLYFTPSR